MRSCRKFIAAKVEIEWANDGCSPAHMKALFKLSKAKTLIWKELPYGDHNSTVAEPGYFMFIEEFLRQYVLRSS